MAFEIEVDDKTAPDYAVSDNVAENLVDVIRSDMVGNESQFLALNAAYMSGLSVEPSEYIQVIVRGKSGEGKTELKQNVDTLYPNHWLLRAGSTSDMGMVDADIWDERYVGAFAEFQQIQGKMLEMIKSSAGDDADEDGVGFSHTRNVDDGDGGREADEIQKQSMPTVFLFADENNSEIPQELQTRQMVIRVESDEKINRAVAKTKFDHKEVEVGDRDYEYNYNFEDGKQAVKNHIANVPKPLEATWSEDPKSYSYPVVIPHDEGIDWPLNDHPTHDSYGWDVFKVVDDILSYKKTQSKRGAQAIANHIRAWARLNYHNRETMDIGGVTHLVAEPQDVGNVLAYRDLLLAVTHDMNEQKLAVIDALTDEVNGVGGTGPNGGLQATHMDIRQYIDEYSDITTPSKSQLTGTAQNAGILGQMEEDYLIEIHEGDGPNGAHMYEFLGGSTFGHPNLDVYSELFSEVTDPIRQQPIADTTQQFKEQLSVTTTEDLLSDDGLSIDSDTDDESDDLSAFGAGDGDTSVDLDEVEQRVYEALRDTLDDARATPADIEGLDLQHMLGISPVEYYTDDTGFTHVRAERPRESEDRTGTIMDASHELWGDKSDQQVETRIENAVEKLRREQVFEIESDENSEFENAKYFVVNNN
ncbi:hypothetical protein HAPG_00050 [Halorubrum phage GNf2]|nr:hypothetical protein HAPG_00050 [Halorubrum phage GNf2]